VSALGVGESRAQLGPTFAILAVDLRQTLAEKEAQEQVIRESGLDWLIVRPGALTDGPHTGAYRCVTDPAVALPRALISRADVADFILKHLAGHEYLGQAVSLAY